MTKQDYIQSQLALGKTITEIINEQPTELVQGSLLKSHYQEIKTVLCAGLREHIDEFVPANQEQKSALYSLRETFTEEYLSDNDFKVNFNVPEVMGLFRKCVECGALPKAFADRLIELAKYKRPVYNIERDDFLGEWNVLDIESKATVMTFRLKTRTPEPTKIIIQSQDVYPDGSVSDWYDNTVRYGIQIIREYRIELSHGGYPRKLRWRSEYVLDVDVSE